MGYIPPDAKWYLAYIVIEIKIESEPRNVVQTNIILIRADSPEEAYKKALEFGNREEHLYVNSAGKQVHAKFRGLRDLNVIHEDLEDGAELTYEEEINVSEDKIQSRIALKDELSVFAPIKLLSGKPNYISEDIVEAMEKEGFKREDLI